MIRAAHPFPRAMLSKISNARSGSAGDRLVALGNRPVPERILERSAALPTAGDPNAMLRELAASVETFKSKQEDRVIYMQAAFDDINKRLAAIGLNGPGGPGDLPPEPGYSQPFADYFRKGSSENELRTANATGDRARIQAALSSGNDSQGGYLAPVEWDRKILQQLRVVSPLRRLADVVQTTTRGYSTVWSDGLWGTGWVGETATRPGTTTPGLASISFAPGEIYANPAIAQNLLDDADFRVEDWLSNEVGQVFALQEGIAFISGDGINKPKGFLTHVGETVPSHPGGSIPTVPSGSASAITSDALVELVYSLGAPYRQGAAFLMSSTTASAISKLKDGQGNYIWRESIQVGQPSTLLGYEVAIDEGMPGIAAGNLPVAFGNWRAAYVINDRGPVRVLRDPYTSKPYVQFYTTKRVGGGLKDPRALRVLIVAAS